MDNFNVDRSLLVAAFSGAIAYLCTKERMPILRALALAFAGTAAAYYIGPVIAQWAEGHFGLDNRAIYAVVFITGVSGIWLINILVAVLEKVEQRSGKIADKIITDDDRKEGTS